MKTALMPYAEPAALAMDEPHTPARSRLADYVALTRPRLSLMALFTVGVGYFLGAGPEFSTLMLVHTLFGTALVACGASALNQWMERKSDALMRRTMNRPLPAGRLHPAEALMFGLFLSVGGLAYLGVSIPNLAAAGFAGLTLVSYLAIYTPLKQQTVWNTVVGAVPGALPPLIGWSAAQGTITEPALVLFGLLFVWQLPHFFAIAWMYREDYASGGLRMLPAIDPTGRITTRAMLVSCALLVGLCIGAVLVKLTGPLFLAGAFPLCLMFWVASRRFGERPSQRTARHVLRASLVYLLGLMLLLMLTPILPKG